MERKRTKGSTTKKHSESFDLIIKEIGFENAKKICRIVGGDNVYIPMVETLERPFRDQMIRDEFTGYNLRELASKYNKSVATIRYICKDTIKKKRMQPLSGQLNLFEIESNKLT